MMNTDKEPKLLIIDDDKFLVDMYALKFEETNFDVETAFTAKEALERLKSETKPDIILLDILIPDMDGFELLQKIKAEKLADNSLIVILSNLGQKADVEKGIALGADGYIVKAVSTPKEVVEKLLEISKIKTPHKK